METKRKPARVLLVDDSPQFLWAVQEFISRMPELEVVGCAASGEESLAAVDALRPDLVLMDIKMPGIGGLEATRRIKARHGAPRVIVLTSHDPDDYRDAALASGADAFMAKDDFSDDFPALAAKLTADAPA